MKPSVLITLALLMGAGAVFLVARWVGVGGPAHTGPRVVVMAGAIEAGLPLAANHLQVLTWPGATAPQGAFDKTEAVVGRVVRQAMVPGEPVLETRLAPGDAKGGLSATLAAGKRAITVRVNDVIGVAGFALPGTYVDVLVSARDNQNNPFSKTVLERVRILAVAQEMVSDPATPKVVNAVTLELTPAESERLDLARSVGSLSLSLRNELDRIPMPSVLTRLDDLMHLANGNGSATGAATGPEPAASAVRRASVKTTNRKGEGGATSSFGIEEFRGTARGTPGQAGAGAQP